MRKNDPRKNERSPVRLSAEVYPVFPSYRAWLAEMEMDFFTGFLNDLSQGGLCLTVGLPLLKGSVLKFRFLLNKKLRVEIFGKVVWTRRTLSGVRFFPLTGEPQKAIAAHLAKP